MWRFAPDVDPTTPEIYTAMSRMIPTPWGTYRTSPGSATTGGGPATAPLASELFLRVDGTATWVVGSTTKLYNSDGTGGTFTDRSGGSTYSASTGLGYIWTFAQFGDTTIATQLGDNPKSATTGNFADLAGSPPKAGMICIQSNAVILANVNTGSAIADGWYASDVGSAVTWTGGESANGRLIQTPGPITCLLAFSGRVLAFKETSVYEGQYVGGVVKWAWRLLHPTIGVSGPRGACTDGLRVFIYGLAGAYLYDGSQFSRIDSGVEKTLQSGVPPSNSMTTFYSYAERAFFISTYAYCPDSGLWGITNSADENGIGSFYREARVPPGYTRRGFVFNGVATYTGCTITANSYTKAASSVTTGWIGGDRVVTQVHGVIPLLTPAGDYSYSNCSGANYPAQIAHKTAQTRAGTMAALSYSPVNINRTTLKFDVNASAPWHEFTITDSTGSPTALEGGMELAGIDFVIKSGGTNVHPS